jgi:hypothetical protein
MFLQLFKFFTTSLTILVGTSFTFVFINTTRAEDVKVYKHSVITETHDKTIKCLGEFFPDGKKSNLYEYDSQKTFSENIKRIRTDVDEVVIQFLGKVTSNLIEDSNIKPSDCDDYAKIRFTSSKYYLDTLKIISRGIDPNHDYNRTWYLNIPYEGYINGYHMVVPGMDPESIEDPAERKRYEKILWDNSVLANERRVQRSLTELNRKIPELLSKFFVISYSQSPRADDELVKLLEEYQYPEEEKIKIFKALNIAYKGFRDWQTKDNLFNATAKFISLSKGNVTIEKENGKRATIELSALRKVDQDYVEEQLAPKPETPKTGSSP